MNGVQELSDRLVAQETVKHILVGSSNGEDHTGAIEPPFPWRSTRPVGLMTLVN